jgi:hypothetical protein
MGKGRRRGERRGLDRESCEDEVGKGRRGWRAVGGMAFGYGRKGEKAC